MELQLSNQKLKGGHLSTPPVRPWFSLRRLWMIKSVDTDQSPSPNEQLHSEDTQFEDDFDDD